VDSCFSVLSLYSKQKFIECVEEEVSRGYENVIAKESQITIKLPKDGQTTKLKYACKALLGRKWRLHPLIHTFPTRKLNTKCGIIFFRDEVWIKVWQVNSQGKVRGLRLT
jgi:hypothetical protein